MMNILMLHIFWEIVPGDDTSRNGEVSVEVAENANPPTAAEMQSMAHAAKMEFARLRRKKHSGHTQHQG